MMIKKTFHTAEAVTALFLSAAILMGSTLLAQEVEESSLYRQSQFYKSIFSQDAVDFTDVFTSTESIDMLVKFAGAVTSAYINFELIPVNEAKTFAAIFESRGEGVHLERFEYHRKDLMIYGEADDQAAYEAFVQSLQDRRYFQSVSGHAYTTNEDTVRFQLLCTSAANNWDSQQVFATIF